MSLSKVLLVEGSPNTDKISFVLDSLTLIFFSFFSKKKTP